MRVYPGVNSAIWAVRSYQRLSCYLDVESGIGALEEESLAKSVRLLIPYVI